MAESFRELRIWQNGVAAAIAEAYGRYYFADKVRVLYVGRGECLETQSHLSVALGKGYITKDVFTFLDNEYSGLAKGINSYVLNLKNRKRDLP